ncbi:tetratricopeptide repeat protein [Sporolactobacillus sp. THM7-4]|nr:tetratricopeptide repeat protein [Sporolactobacillus sp. THM7-4]
MKEGKNSDKAQVISFHPDGEFFFKKGMACYQRGELENASRYIERALSFKPNEVEYLCQQAAILSELEQYESSISLLKKVVYELDDNMTECYFFMANNYAYLGEFQEALEEVNTYLALEPNGAFQHEAMELYQMLTDETGNMAEESSFVSTHERGRRALEHGRYEEAINLFQDVIKDEPDFLAAQNNLTIAYFSIGETDQAIGTAMHVLERDPGNIHALCNLATFFYDLDDKKNLNEILKRLDHLYPFFPEHCGKLGSTYLYVCDYEKAYEWLTFAKKNGARVDQVFSFWMALAAYHVGRMDLAEKNWENVDFFSNKPFHPFKYNKIQEMMFEPGANGNFMVRDLLKREIWESNQSYQLFSLFYLSHAGDEELLAEAAENGPNPAVKTVARRLLRERLDERPSGRLQIMREVERQLGGGKETIKHAELYSFWAVADTVIDQDSEIDWHGWAGALLYLWKKEFGVHTSQKEIAESVGSTVYRVRKHIRELSGALEKQWEEGMMLFN